MTNRLTKFEKNPNSKFPYKLKDESLCTELDCIHKLGLIEDLMEKYNVEGLEELDKLLTMATSYEELSKPMKRIDICLKLATGNSVSCFNYKGKTIACMSVEKYNDLLSRALKNKENKND
jgi:hypothetical protein